jgi:hypothetical protein
MNSALREPEFRRLLERLADEMPLPMEAPPGALRRGRRKLVRNAVVSAALAAIVVAASVTGVGAILRSAPSPRPADTPSVPPPVEGGGRFESPLYGYGIDLPNGWTAQPAVLTWEWGESVFELGELPNRADIVTDPSAVEGGSLGWVLGIAAVPLPGGFTAEDWRLRVRELYATDGGDCLRTDPGTPIPLDGAVGQLAFGCEGRVRVTFVSQGRGYLLTTWTPSVARFDQLREMLATLRPNPQPVANPTDRTAWRGIFPQATRAEGEEAQRRADAGDPTFTWQVDPDGDQARWGAGDVVAMRFLEERLGWNDYRLPSGGWSSEGYANLVFVRCEPGRENSAYPFHCAPASGNAFTTILVRMERLVDPGAAGIWIVTRYAMLPAFEQATPPTEQEVRDLVTDFLEARIAGRGAESYLLADWAGVQLLYGTTRGVPYGRFEIVRVGKPQWPDGWVQVEVRLFAEGGNVVVEQTHSVAQPGPTYGLTVPPGRWIVGSGYTTENGAMVDF